MAFSSDQISELLPVYYRRLFPYEQFCRWLSYGLVNPSAFSNREMSFTLPGDVYIRYQSFDDREEFEKEVLKKCPEKIDIGAIYNIKPRRRRMASNFDVREKELIFDIDMTDYDSVRTCCSDAEVCHKCWELLIIATRILDTALREDFGFRHLLWVFSGRRGVHCWVCDANARRLEPRVRSDIAEYLQLLSREDVNGKEVHLTSGMIHPSIRRAVDIIKSEFKHACVVGQDILGTEERQKKILKILGDPTLRNKVEEVWNSLPASASSLDRWSALVSVFESMVSKGTLRKSKNLLDEIMLQYAYPRLDIEVSKGYNHLLKAPFCIHPKTGKVCIPFNPLAASKFNPDAVPTITDLMEEIQDFDAKEKENSVDVKRKVKDYKKTSMFKGVKVFEEFLRELEESWKDNSMEVDF